MWLVVAVMSPLTNWVRDRAQPGCLTMTRSPAVRFLCLQALKREHHAKQLCVKLPQTEEAHPLCP